MSKFCHLMVILMLLPAPCWAGGGGDKGAQPAPKEQRQQVVPASPGEAPPPRQSEYWAGDGGKGMSIAILAPQAAGLAENQSYLPALVQGEFVSNFSGYSAISVLDRQRLDEQYAELLSGYYDDHAEAGLDLGHLMPTDYIMGGNITRTAAGYALQMQITKTADKMTAASHSAMFTFAELDNLTGIRRASLALIEKMGVTPTAKTREELTGAAMANHVNAQTALAQGIAAQRQGTEIAALSYYFQAAAFDSSLAEAANRSSILAANISSGNIGEDARNDIAWRNAWVKRLAEAEQYFNSYFDNLFKNIPMPYSLFYTSDIKQIGDINYRDETLTIGGMETFLIPSHDWLQSIEPVLRSIQASLQAMIDGLNATERKAVWGLANWPQQGSFNLQPFGRQNKTFSIVAELLNSRNQVISRQSFQTAGYYDFTIPLPGRGTQKIQISAGESKTIIFPNVKASDITDSLIIRIASVNGTSAENAARSGELQIKALSESEFYFYRTYDPRYQITEKGEITGYTGSETDIQIPSTINGIKVTAIGETAFIKKSLTNVSIPDSVISIGNAAFRENKLSSVTIPNSVVFIGNSAFHGNQLTNVTISNSVTSIETGAFMGNQLTSVTIPSSVTSIGEAVFHGNRLTSVTIPNGITSIKAFTFWNNQLTNVIIPSSVTRISDAFYGNPLISITIGANVDITGNPSTYGAFIPFYNNNGRKAGVYTFSNDRWNYSPR